MKQDNDILTQIGHRDGMTVPEGFFAKFAEDMAASLPPTEFEKSADPSVIKAPRTLWQRVRPYVYMAAMFAGVWCMMKMFSQLTSSADPLTPSPILAEALDNEVFVNDYLIDDFDDYELMDEMMENGFDLTSLSDSIDEIEEVEEIE